MGGNSYPPLIKALQNPSVFPHPVGNIEVLETHISWVILTGRYAYKIKKPVNLGFLDFSNLENRSHYCHEELRLNRRLAPQIYLDVVTITGSATSPSLNGEGTVVDYAVRMVQFPRETQLDNLAVQGNLTREHIDHLIQHIAEFHGEIADIATTQHFGEGEAVFAPARENYAHIFPQLSDSAEIELLRELERWSDHVAEAKHDAFISRKANGFIRECHGDLHLGNMALFENEPLIFDCIEFSEKLRWIDIMSDVAFLVMDLIHRNRPEFARRFLNGYLEIVGDYEGLAVLPFYLVYRALVRCKVELIRLDQQHQVEPNAPLNKSVYRSYLDVARGFTQSRATEIIITHGFSGSGKSTITQLILEKIDAIRVRSDVERKRLHGLTARQRSDSRVQSGLYTEAASRETYNHLLDLAEKITGAGYSAIIDATFLKKAQRAPFRRLAQILHVPFVILDFRAPIELLRHWITERQTSDLDASEADLSVLDHQLRSHEPLSEEELPHVITVNTEHEVDVTEVIDKLLTSGRSIPSR